MKPHSRTATTLPRPRPGTPPVPTVPRPERFELDNGLRVLAVQRGDLPQVAARLVVPAGASADPDTAPGIASFVGSLLIEGTHDLSATALNERIDMLGASLSARVGHDFAEVDLGLLSETLDEGLALLAAVVAGASFPEREVERIRAETLDVLEARLDEPANVADDHASEAVFGAHHPYGRLPIGTAEGVSRLRQEELVAFHRAQYRPTGCVLVLGGDLGSGDLRRRLETAFAAWEGTTAPVDYPAVPIGPVVASEILNIEWEEAAQGELRVAGIGLPRASQDWIAGAVANYILGGSTITGRLGANLREDKGWTYGVRSGFAAGIQPGGWIVETAVDTAAAGEALAEIEGELHRMISEVVTDEELTRAREALILSLPRAFETPARIVSRLATIEAYGLESDYWERFPGRAQLVSREDVARIAATCFAADRLVRVVVGPRMTKTVLTGMPVREGVPAVTNQAEQLVLMRLSAELSTKARGTRRRFMRRLVRNVRDALETTGAEYRVESQWTRIFVRTSADPARLAVLERIAGISSVSTIVARCSADLDEIARTGIEHFAGLVKGRTYAVRARRSGTHSFTSGDISNRLGAALNPGATVNLSHPDIEVHVEVRDEDTYFFSEKRPAWGGLPLAVEGRGICLLSGGFDSAVAAWMMLKRGVQLDYVFCNLAGDAYERSVAQVAKVLADRWSYGTQPKLHIVDFAEVLDELRAKTRPTYWQLVLKRLMYRAADEVGTRLRAQAIFTGEAIGQVSSQTLANLAAIDRSSQIPVFRPLIGFDKMDIIELSRRIGTFDLSSKVKEYCAIAPGNPATRGTARETEAEEAKIDPSILRRALDASRVLDLRGLHDSDLAVGYLFTDDVPRDAIVVDLRSEDEWEAWHYPGSLHRPSWELTSNPRSLGRDGTFVLYCDQGSRSAQVAEAMQRAGVEAYAFKGGTAALRRRVESEPVPEDSPR